jgi:hypothetical protein
MILKRLPLPAFAFLAGTMAAGNAGAQVTGAIEAGSGAVRLGASNATEVLSVAPMLQLRGKYFRLDARGDYAEHADRGWQTSGLVAAAIQLPLARWLKAEFAGTGGWSRLSWGQAAAGTLAEARLQLIGPARGLELSAGTGRAFPDGPSGALSRVEARTWSRMAGLDFGFLLRRTGVMTPGASTGSNSGSGPPLGDTLAIPPSGGPARRLQDHYTDFNATIGWARNNVEVEGGLGRRFGRPVHQYTSWQIQGLYWLTERVALVASAGRFPTDVVSGLPSGNFALLSMRISWKDRVVPSRISSPARASNRSTAFEARRTGDGQVALAVWAPGALRVEAMGSFSDWQPVELQGGEPGWWRAELPLAAGLYEINVRFEGGPWQVPTGLQAVSDGFGGTVGVFTIED